MRRRIYITIAVVLLIMLSAGLTILAYNVGQLEIELDETRKNVGAKVDALCTHVGRIEHHLQSLGHPVGRPPEEAP